MTTPQIRPAKNTDQDAVRALVFSVLHEYDIEPAPKTTDRDLYDLEGYYGEGMFAVLETPDGDIAGTVGLAPLSSASCELRKMYLSPKYRGRGFGAKLLKHAVERARALGFAQMELSTKRIMEEAIGLYTKFGFTSLESGPVDKRCDQTLILDLKDAR